MLVNIYEAKTKLSKLIQMLVENDENEIIIAKNNKPLVKMVLCDKCKKNNRVGIAKSKLPDISLEDFNSIDVIEDFLGKDVL